MSYNIGIKGGPLCTMRFCMGMRFCVGRDAYAFQVLQCNGGYVGPSGEWREAHMR